jgi:hypothetical protein
MNLKFLLQNKNWIIKISVCLIFFFSIACGNAPQSPTFLRLNKVKIKSVGLTNVAISGEAIFNNPNAIGGKLTKTNIHIKVNNKDITDIQQNVSVNIPKNNDFTIPINFSFNPKEITNNEKGFFKNTFKAFLNKDLEVDYYGSITVNMLGINFEVPIDYSEKVSLDLKYDDLN